MQGPPKIGLVLRAVNPRFGERFGSSVAVSGTRLAVGAPDRAPCGAVTLFRRAKSSWVVEQVIAPTAGGRFGGAIALDRDGNISLPFNTEGMYRGWIKPDGSRGVAIFKD